jgi:hypothetical protein
MNVNQLEGLAATIDGIQNLMIEHGVSPALGQSLDIIVSAGSGGGEQVTLSVRLEDVHDDSSWYLDAALS